MKTPASIALAAFLCATPALAQQPNKCADAKGKITYTMQKCEELKLKPLGQIEDKVSSQPPLPAVNYPKAAAPAPGSPGAKAPPPAMGGMPGQTPPALPPGQTMGASKEAERRCFTTAQGTRCNDVPEGKPQ